MGIETLATDGGVFDVAAVVDLGPSTHVGRPPAVEDHAFSPSKASFVRESLAPHFWKGLNEFAKPSLSAVFGRDLQANGRTCAVEEGKGEATLGLLMPGKLDALILHEQAVLCRLVDAHFGELSVRVTDLRLHQGIEPLPRTVQRVNAELRKGVRAVLSVGLGRAWPKPGETVKRHWLMVNNIHLESDPAWKVARRDPPTECREPKAVYSPSFPEPVGSEPAYQEFLDLGIPEYTP